MMRSIYTLLTFCIILFAANVNAQQKPSFSLKGKIVDSTSNSAVQFATLTIATAANPEKQVKVLATDDKGNFQTSLATTDEYILSVFYFGTKAADIPFSIKAEQRMADLGTLYISEDNLLQEAVVIAQKPLVTVELDKLTYDTQSDPESKTETALEMLRKVPMVTVDAEDKIQLRGSGNFKVYVNGKPSTMLTNNPSEVLKSMPASNIKNIEVITDPGAKYDAEGIGGIINITMVTRTDDGYKATVGAFANTQGAYGGNAFLTLKYGKFGFSGNYGYNYWTRPTDEMHTEQYFYASNNALLQNSRTRYKMPMQWGSGELSYELNSFNMFTASFNRFYGKQKGNSSSDVSMHQNSNSIYSYLRQTKGETEMGNTEVNADYQRSFKKQGMLLTASYRYGNSPNDSENETETYQTVSYPNFKERSWNDADMNEHTFQLDYVNPIKGKHIIETGGKYIIRSNDSDVYFEEYNFSTNRWTHNSNRENDMDYKQNIFSGYASYSYKLSKWGLKLGARIENTDTDADFRQVDGKFSKTNSNTTDVIPSAAISYQLAPTKTLRLNYNMRILRPSISYLNSFINDSDPTNISYGNPNLESERTNNLSLSYGSFSQRFNLNISLRYAYTDNSIEQYAFIKNGVTNNTYDNIGKKQTTALDLFASWTPIKDLRLMVNGSVGYSDIKSNGDLGWSNNGFLGNIFANASYSFLSSFRVNVVGGYFKQPIGLQTEMSSFSFMGLGLGKDFFDKKLSLNISAQSPFKKYTDITMKTRTRDFYANTDLQMSQQSVNFRISYKFGNLKNGQIKKVQRGISNDDLIKSSGGAATGLENTPTTN